MGNRKSHPGYFKGKKIDKDLFYEAINLHFSGPRISMKAAAEHCGVSEPTFRTRLRYIYEHNGESKPEWWLNG